LTGVKFNSIAPSVQEVATIAAQMRKQRRRTKGLPVAIAAVSLGCEM